MKKSFRSNRFVASNTGLTAWFFPPRLDILNDKVLLERRKYLGMAKDETSVGYHLMTGIGIRGGLIWSTITIETGGTASLSMFGLRRKVAQEVKGILDRKRVEARQPAESRPPAGKSEIADQLEKLADLKKRGLITEDEFKAKKRDLLARM